MALRHKSLVARVELALHPKRLNQSRFDWMANVFGSPPKMHLQLEANEIFGNSFVLREAHPGDGVHEW